MMIQSFFDRGTEDVFNGKDTKAARKTLPRDVLTIGRRKLDQLNQAARLDDLRAPPGNRLEALKGDRKGQHSIRINDRFRICFVWAESGPDQVEITDYH
jgi:proteic killer suppression protein